MELRLFKTTGTTHPMTLESHARIAQSYVSRQPSEPTRICCLNSLLVCQQLQGGTTGTYDGLCITFVVWVFCSFLSAKFQQQCLRILNYFFNTDAPVISSAYECMRCSIQYMIYFTEHFIMLALAKTQYCNTFYNIKDTGYKYLSV